MFHFDVFKRFLIFTKLGKLAILDKFGRKIGQISFICQLSLNLEKNQIMEPTTFLPGCGTAYNAARSNSNGSLTHHNNCYG